MSDSKIEEVVLEEIGVGNPGKAIVKSNPLDLVKDVKVQLTVLLGDVHVSVGEFMGLKEQSVLSMDRLLNEPVDMLLDGKVVARGNLVAVGDHFGLQITEIKNKPE